MANDITLSNGLAGLRSITRGSRRNTWPTPRRWSVGLNVQTERNARDGHDGLEKARKRAAPRERVSSGRAANGVTLFSHRVFNEDDGPPNDQKYREDKESVTTGPLEGFHQGALQQV